MLQQGNSITAEQWIVEESHHINKSIGYFK